MARKPVQIEHAGETGTQARAAYRTIHKIHVRRNGETLAIEPKTVVRDFTDAEVAELLKAGAIERAAPAPEEVTLGDTEDGLE